MSKEFGLRKRWMLAVRHGKFRTCFICVCVTFILLLIGLQENWGTRMFVGQNEVLHIKRTFVSPGTDVILSSYMRSGSSLLGRILGHRDDTFNFYEPLWKVRYMQYYKDANLVCDYKTTKCINHTEIENGNWFSRLTRGAIHRNDARLSEALAFLQSILDCDFYRFPNFMQDHIHSDLALAGKYWSVYKDCIESDIDKVQCLLQQAAICKTATHRHAKVLRMSPLNLEVLLLRNRRLKIVHLFRDPRKVIFSHLNTDFYHLDKSNMHEVFEDVNALCNRLQDDIIDLKLLVKKYPERVKVVRYEDYTNSNASIDTIVNLYKFVNYSYSESELQEIKCEICWRNDCCGTTKFQSRDFRQKMDPLALKSIDTECGNVYKELGYVVFQNDTALKLFRDVYTFS